MDCGTAHSHHEEPRKPKEHMNLQIESRSVGGVAVLSCKGRLAYGEGLDVLYERVGRLLHAKTPVLLNLAEVENIDAAGLGVLADMAAHAWDWGGQLKLCSVQQQVAEVIALTHITGVLECYDTERDGLASYLGAAAFWRAS